MNVDSMISRKLPIGIQSFEKLRTEGYLYVDKTELVYRLVKLGKPYFLSRPRREESAALYFGGLLPRKKGVVRGSCHRRIGAGLVHLSGAASGSQCREI